MNYLVLTPDGVGSTLLQRALTVYLNSSDLEYYNTHELLNGIELNSVNAVVKNFKLDYSQDLDTIKSVLESGKKHIVSRIADYHQYNRLEEKQEDYFSFYTFCNQYFNKILYCVRDPYEYALSWAIRKETKILNVYTLDTRIEHHGVDKKYNIDLDYFEFKLQQYQQYYYWAMDSFPAASPVEYNSLNYNIDQQLRNITQSNFNIIDKFGVSLNEYSKIFYKMSLKKQNLINNINVEKSKIKGTLNLYNYQNLLCSEQKLVTRIPIKMSTMQEKQNKIINFNDTIAVFNNWTKSTNEYQTIDLEYVKQKIDTESSYYAY
jgi:hypothetical protein